MKRITITILLLFGCAAVQAEVVGTFKAPATTITVPPGAVVTPSTPAATPEAAPRYVYADGTAGGTASQGQTGTGNGSVIVNQAPGSQLTVNVSNVSQPASTSTQQVAPASPAKVTYRPGFISSVACGPSVRTVQRVYAPAYSGGGSYGVAVPMDSYQRRAMDNAASRDTAYTVGYWGDTIFRMGVEGLALYALGDQIFSHHGGGYHGGGGHVYIGPAGRPVCRR